MYGSEIRFLVTAIASTILYNTVGFKFLLKIVYITSYTICRYQNNVRNLMN